MKKILINLMCGFLICSCSNNSRMTFSTPATSQPEQSTQPRITDTAIPVSSPNTTDEPIFMKNRWIGRGVNLGNALEAPKEGEWGVYLKEDYFQKIKDAGFQSVRIPTRWSAHATLPPPYTINNEFFDRVDWVINQSLSRELTVVLNIHHFNEMYENPKLHQERFLSIWSQISDHYKNYPEQLFFEILNEPNGTLRMDTWNNLVWETITLIRNTNPDRPIVVGPGEWNSINQLRNLRLPENDRNIIVTFHYYQPFHFTHQGAEWVNGSNAWLGTRWSGSEKEVKSIQTDIKSAAQWGIAQNRPIFLGEFGAYNKADIESRARWTTTVARIAEEFGISWTYWEFCAGFGLYDPVLKQWNQPLRIALLPED